MIALSANSDSASEFINTEHHHRVQKKKERKRLQRQRQRQQRQRRQRAILSAQLVTQSNQSAVSSQQVVSSANIIDWNVHRVKQDFMGIRRYLLEDTLHRAPNMGPKKSRGTTFQVIYLMSID